MKELSLQRNKGKHQKPLNSIVGFIPKGKTTIPLKWSYSPIYLSADSTFWTFSQNHPLLALPPLPSSVLELRPHSCLYIHPCLPRDQAIFPPVARMIQLKCTPDQVIGYSKTHPRFPAAFQHDLTSVPRYLLIPLSHSGWGPLSLAPPRRSSFTPPWPQLTSQSVSQRPRSVSRPQGHLPLTPSHRPAHLQAGNCLVTDFSTACEN